MPTSRSALDVLLLFDVEDIFSPCDAGTDDSIKELADILSAAGLPGVFLFIGDKAELLAERGRTDVIESLRPHELGLHTRSAVHPCGPEYVANRAWDDGLSESLRREREGAEIIGRVFGKPCCALSTHWMFASPHALAAAGRLGLPYVYAYPSAPPLHSLSWYCGALCFPWFSPTHDDSLFLPYFDGFDDDYHDAARLDATITRFSTRIDQCLAAGHPFMSVLLYHPQRVRLAEFIDGYMTPNGYNRPADQWHVRGGSPRRYTPEQVRANLEGFRNLVRWIRADPRLRPVTMAETVRTYGAQPTVIDRDELARAARRIVQTNDIALHPCQSPAEIVCALAQSLIGFDEKRKVPESVVSTRPLGPKRNPIYAPERPALTWAELVRFARDVRSAVAETAHLPADFGEPLDRVGINHLYDAFARAYLHVRNTGSSPDEIPLRRMPRHPEIGIKIARRFIDVADGPNIDPELNVDAMYRHAKLQTWTLKPATGG